ncbi:hypothetical protein U1Q18_018762 [Sarracenia purpurea var. burkii]
MGTGSWHKFRSRSIHLGRSYSQTDRELHIWLKIWRKIKRDHHHNKKKKTPTPTTKTNSNSVFSSSYDPATYLQNFDEGSGRTEPDNYRRSFSARFADPSRNFYGIMNC